MQENQLKTMKEIKRLAIAVILAVKEGRLTIPDLVQKELYRVIFKAQDLGV